MRNLSAIFLGTAVAWTTWVHAADAPPALQAVPEPPDIPQQVKSGETLEPEVTISTDAEKTVTEYRINGRLHSIKVVPVVGPTYWLVDTTGDGFTNTRYDNYYPPFAIPGWVILRW